MVNAACCFYSGPCFLLVKIIYVHLCIIKIKLKIMKEEMKNAVENALERLSSEQFTTLLISLDELEIWKEGLRYGIDGINDVSDRMNVIDHNFRKAEYEMYFNKLRELNFI